ncbi:sulfite oxidase [Bacillus sp. S/N-304-OC-R1]|uniref:sulfite oxidase n=1 Tax=Bacillus sp. S/N-304-OC-R1 TaxID=2758034 RepID=UPI001C8EA9AD|nr:sulfite oxidase [Bacillus sp. S/N-304-OC-R1]MBY0123320.1 sulfite oxidase [Bacillus sp. S/N-304-OC-R1]
MFKHPSIKPYLKTHSLVPENQETPFRFIQTALVPTNLFYRRNHFSYPAMLNHWLPINGHVKTPLLVSMQDILRLPSKTIKVTLECSGNKRSLFEPKVFGEQWEKGAINQGNWKGVSLRTLLEQAGLKEGAAEVVAEGYDYGKRTDSDQVHTFARSLPLEKALHPDTLIAYEYNHQPLPFKHGYPFRLIVPQWYAMASVKWVKQITVIQTHFEGPFQSTDYVYYPYKENDNDAFPVTTLNINSTIQLPLHMEFLDTGKHLIKGIAWTGEGYITKVEVSTDYGQTWTNAVLSQDRNKYGLVSWSYQWSVSEPGEYAIMSRATDSLARTQPAKAFWNRKGYGYNAVDQIKVKVE